MKHIISTVLVTALALAACNQSEFVVPDEAEDLVQSTSGKSDTGYMSTLSTELEGEFRGELLQDVTSMTAEQRQALVETYRTNAYQLKELAMNQVKFGKNKINAEQLHMNMYSDTVETETVELVGETTVRVVYKVKLESIVSHEELEKAGKSIESVLANPTTTVKLPADPTAIFTRVGEKCAEGFDAGTLADYNYFYYFKPDKAGCDLALTDGTFTVSSLAPPKTTYPEYDRLGADKKVNVFVIFSAAEHKETVDNYDWGMMEWRDFKRFIEGRGFSKIGAWDPKGERYRRIKNGYEEIIDLICPTDIYNNPDSDAIFKKGIAEHEVVLYNGHSFYGSLNVLRDCTMYPADTYQIFYWGSCWSYEYYTRQIFECRKTEQDPMGWGLADVVNDTESGWFHNNAEFSRILLTNLFAGVETGGKDGDKYYTWYNIIAAMNQQALDAWQTQGTETHEIMGVSGVKNNKYDPEATQPGSQGSRYESTTSYDIPDNSTTGVESEIVVTSPVTPSRITVSVNIEHSYIGDLRVVLVRGSNQIVLHDREGGWEDNIVKEYETVFNGTALIGQDAQGSWILHVDDNQAQDTGKIKGWSITLVP